jgi:ketol-acid reductoisomerase
VVVGARPAGGGWAAAEREGFETREIARAVADADAVVVLLPDEAQGDVFAREGPATQPERVRARALQLLDPAF